MAYPNVRHRRLRSSESMRRLVRETQVDISDFIYPIFVTEGEGVKQEISSMPGIYRFSLDRLRQEIEEVSELNIPAIMLFGIPHHKDEVGSEAYAEEGIVQQAIRRIKEWNPNLLVAADTCLCEYTSHGHCGIVHHDAATGRADVDNDRSLELHVKTAISQAQAGADIIAPSSMMDGFVSAIRSGLDQSGYAHIPILSYAVKYASAFYGPFRDAADSAPQFGDRRTYQMDPANLREALREAESDVVEGADMLMVKPALAYMDVIRAVKEHFDLPVVCYNVSGEYSMVKAAALNGWVDERPLVQEMLTGFKRAGADMIITYFAKDAARWLKSME